MPIWIDQCVEAEVSHGTDEERAREVCMARYKKKRARRKARLSKKRKRKR